MFAESAACSQLSTLRKLTSLVAGERATYHLQAMLPALQALIRLKCIVNSFHTDDSGALPVLGELITLEDLHMEGRLEGDYKLAFLPPLKVPTTLSTLTCRMLLRSRNGKAHLRMHAADSRLPVVRGM